MKIRRALWMSYRTVGKIARITGLNRLPVAHEKTLGGVVDRIARGILSTRFSGAPISTGGHKMFLGSAGLDYAPEILSDDYEPWTTRIFLESLRPGMTVVDVGANIGYYTLHAAGAVGETGRVFAFEPSSANCSLLERNIALNRYRNVIVIRKAVGDRDGTTDLFIGSSGQHSLYYDRDHHKGSEKVVIIPLDLFLEDRGCPVLHLVKIDVEGAELAVLKGMRRSLAKSEVRRLIIEFCAGKLRKAGTEPTTLLSWLRETGFRINVIDERRGLQPLQASKLLRRLSGHHDHVNLLCER